MVLPDHIASVLIPLQPDARTAVVDWTAQLVADRDAQIASLKAQNEKFRSMLFDRRSEKLPRISDQVRRPIDEAEFPLDLPANATEEELAEAKAAQSKAITTARRKKGRKDSEAARQRQRDALNKLPVVHETVVIANDQFPAGTCREDFRNLGDGEVIHRLEYVREHLACVEYRLEKLVEKAGERIIQASAPPNVVPGGAWGASVYAYAVVAKCVDSLPLYRQEKILGRAGHPIARSVLCGLFHRAAQELEPLYNRLLELVRLDPYLNADETTIRVGEKHAARKAWIWTVVSKQIIYFTFSETRAADTANKMLAGTVGTLQADGYSGYNDVTTAAGRRRAGCWAHARRKFFDARKSAPEADEVLRLITDLYRVEYKAAELGFFGTEAHQLLRQEESQPILKRISAWVEARDGTTNPQSPLAAAITYTVNQRRALELFLTDPNVPLDNNVAERAIRIVAVGRKNFLVVGDAKGGQNLAILQTLTSTCALHDLNPYEYLRDVLVRLGTHPSARLDELLPMNWKPLGR